MREITRQRILREHGNQCAHCGSKENLAVDHIIPVARGGRENELNFQVLCRSCNSKKGKSVDTNLFFKKGDGKTFIYIRRDFANLKLNSSEIVSIITQKLGEFCK